MCRVPLSHNPVSDGEMFSVTDFMLKPINETVKSLRLNLPLQAFLPGQLMSHFLTALSLNNETTHVKYQIYKAYSLPRQ